MHREQEGSVAVKERSILVFLSPVFGLQSSPSFVMKRHKHMLMINDMMAVGRTLSAKRHISTQIDPF